MKQCTSNNQQANSSHSQMLYQILLSVFVVFGVATQAQAQEMVLDNGSANFSTTGAWPNSTSVSGYQGNHYQYQSPSAGGTRPNGILVDNASAGYSATGNWKNSRSVQGYYKNNYQYHAPNNGAPANAIIIDNSASTNTTVGTWPNSRSVSGYQANNYQHNAKGTGNETFTWQLNITTAAQYDVYAKWTAHPNRASNAPYTINHNTGSATVTANQKTNGGTWQLLGTYTLDSSSNITLTDNADGYVIADAIQLLPAGEAALPPLSNTATWTAAIDNSGDYDIYVNWTAHPNRATNAPYTINHSTGTDTVTVNQQANGGAWQLLGTYNFNAGVASISLSDIADGYVIADAVIFSPVGSGLISEVETATWTANIGADATYEVYANWTAHPNRATNATYTINHSNGSDSVTVNQQTNGGAWQLLGTYMLNSGSTITLNNQADGYVVADAIRLVNNAPVTKQIYYIHTDHLNTPRLIEDQNQNTVWEWENQEAFGNNYANEDPNNTGTTFTYNHRFPGQYFDVETQTHYNYFRDYDPDTGRYLQSDPIGLRGGINTYAYALGNPLWYSDPDGRVVQACGLNPAACVQAVRICIQAAQAIARAIAAGLIVETIDCDDSCSPIANEEGEGDFGGLGDDPTVAPPETEWRGRPGSKPGDKDGNYYNPETGESYRPDLDHGAPIGPHWDHRDSNGEWGRIYPDGTREPK